MIPVVVTSKEELAAARAIFCPWWIWFLLGLFVVLSLATALWSMFPRHEWSVKVVARVGRMTEWVHDRTLGDMDMEGYHRDINSGVGRDGFSGMSSRSKTNDAGGKKTKDRKEGIGMDELNNLPLSPMRNERGKRRTLGESGWRRLE